MAVLLSQFLPCHLEPLVSLYITCCPGCTTRKLHMSKPAKPFLKRRSRSSSSSFASSSLDHTVATSSGLILHICLFIEHTRIIWLMLFIMAHQCDTQPIFHITQQHNHEKQSKTKLHLHPHPQTHL